MSFITSRKVSFFALGMCLGGSLFFGTTYKASALNLHDAGFLTPKNSTLLNVISSKEVHAEKFISDMGDKAIEFLSNPSLSQDQKAKEFKTLLEHHFDMATIGRFALGKNWRAADAAQQKEYQSLFQDMIVEVYSTRFNDYQGQSFKVVSSRDSGKKDTLVTSHIVPNSGSKIQVDWRVRGKNGNYKIIDVIIEGVSMSLTQRSDFSSVIQRGGGNIDVLLSHLRK